MQLSPMMLFAGASDTAASLNGQGRLPHSAQSPMKTVFALGTALNEQMSPTGNDKEAIDQIEFAPAPLHYVTQNKPEPIPDGTINTETALQPRAAVKKFLDGSPRETIAPAIPGDVGASVEAVSELQQKALAKATSDGPLTAQGTSVSPVMKPLPESLSGSHEPRIRATQASALRSEAYAEVSPPKQSVDTLTIASMAVHLTSRHEATLRDQIASKGDTSKQGTNPAAIAADSVNSNHGQLRATLDIPALVKPSQAMTRAVSLPKAIENEQVRKHFSSDIESDLQNETVSQIVTTSTKTEVRTLPIAQTPLLGSSIFGDFDVQKLDERGANSEIWMISEEEISELLVAQGSEVKSVAYQSRINADAPRMISAQLVEIARTQSDRPVELTLNPEELGRLRMTFQSDANSMNVVLQVERPETLELMRRNIELLAQDLRELGYDDVSFSFQQQNSSASGGQQLGGTAESDTTEVFLGSEQRAVEGARIASIGTTGMDIRI